MNLASEAGRGPSSDITRCVTDRRLSANIEDLLLLQYERPGLKAGATHAVISDLPVCLDPIAKQQRVGDAGQARRRVLQVSGDRLDTGRPAGTDGLTREGPTRWAWLGCAEQDGRRRTRPQAAGGRDRPPGRTPGRRAGAGP